MQRILCGKYFASLGISQKILPMLVIMGMKHIFHFSRQRFSLISTLLDITKTLAAFPLYKYLLFHFDNLFQQYICSVVITGDQRDTLDHLNSR